MNFTWPVINMRKYIPLHVYLRPRATSYRSRIPQDFRMLAHLVFLIACLAAAVQAQNVVLTNDDGWATANIRAQDSALTSAGFNVSALDLDY